MLKTLEQYHIPATVEEAACLLKAGGPGAYIAGGTDLLVEDPPGIQILVDLTRLGLSFIKEEGEVLRIGATTSLSDLADSPALQSLAGGIVAAGAAGLPSQLLRNAATVGGKVAWGSGLSDVLPPLLALDAEVRLHREAALVGVQDFLARPRDPAALITEVVIPRPPEGTTGAFLKQGRVRTDYSLASVAAVLTRRDGKVVRARVAAGGAFERPQRLTGVEKSLEGRALSRADVEEATGAVAHLSGVLDDFRASRWYRLELLRVLTRRAVLRALEPEGVR